MLYFQILNLLKNFNVNIWQELSWLKKVLDLQSDDIVLCPERDLWKKQLGAQEMYLIFASGDLNNPGSSFGHTFLRVHNPKNIKELELLDYGINYAAITGKDSGASVRLKRSLRFLSRELFDAPLLSKKCASIRI